MTGTNTRRSVGAAVLAVVIVTVAACGVPTGESSFERIPDEDIQFGLNQTTTTTSTTTTTTTTTTLPEVPQSTVEATTTTVPNVLVEVFYVSRGRLQAVPRELPAGFGPNQLAALLEQGVPDGSLGVGLETFVEAGLIAASPTLEGGVISIELDGAVFDRIARQDQRPAIAQIVFTFLRNTTAAGQVSFTIDGEPFSVPTDSGSQELASVDDFPSLQFGGPTPTTEPAETPPATTTA